MLSAVTAVLLFSMGMVILRGVLGRTIFDRILAANNFGTNVIILITLMGYIFGTEFFIDIAITYALINFITTIALLRYFKYSSDEEN